MSDLATLRATAESCYQAAATECAALESRYHVAPYGRGRSDLCREWHLARVKRDALQSVCAAMRDL